MGGAPAKYFQRTASRFETLGTIPEWRLAEVDQTDPAGRYRMGVTADSFVIARSQAAGYANALGSATDFTFFQYDRTNTVLLITAYESNSWYVQLNAGAAASIGTNASLYVQAHATTPSIDLRTGTGAGASLVTRFLVGGGAGTPDIDINTARLDLNGNNIAGVGSLLGNGSADILIRGNKAVTDATARNIAFYLLDPATDAETLLFQATANGLTPSIDLQDNLLLRIGTTGDTGIANISAGLAANTASAGTLEGTPVTPVAIAANSLVVGNITDNADIVLAVSKAGTSHMAFMADASTGDTLLGVPTGQSIDFYIAGVKEIDYATGALAFQQSTTVSAASGTLTINAFTLGGAITAGGNDLNDVGLIYTDEIYGQTGAFYINTTNADSGAVYFRARDNGQTVVQIMAMLGGVDPYLLIGRHDTGVATNAVTDMLVLRGGASTTAVAANFGFGIQMLLSNASSELEERASLDLVLVTATNGSEDVRLDWNLMAGGAMNLAMQLSGLGVLDVDASSALGAATVGLFDEYDDALVLRQGISEQKLEVLENLGIMRRKDTGCGWMLSVQPFLYLLAGGVYQTRQMVDDMRISLEERVAVLEEANRILQEQNARLLAKVGG